MEKRVGVVVSVHAGNSGNDAGSSTDYSKEALPSVQVELGGFVGDRRRDRRCRRCCRNRLWNSITGRS